MKCYFDGSDKNGPDGQRWLTLAGFAAPNCFWDLFEKEWNSEVLQQREPHAPFLHMADLLTGNGVYRGWPVQRRDALIMDALNYLQSRPKLAFRAVACSIDTTAREKLLKEGCRINDPHVICGEYALGAAFNWYYEHHAERIESGWIYFDQGEKFMHPLRDRWQRKKKAEKFSPIIQNSFWGLIANIDPCESRKTPGLQASDLLAWASSRQHAQVGPYSCLAEMARKVVPFSWLILDEKALRVAHRCDLEPEQAE